MVKFFRTIKKKYIFILSLIVLISGMIYMLNGVFANSSSSTFMRAETRNGEPWFVFETMNNEASVGHIRYKTLGFYVSFTGKISKKLRTTIIRLDGQDYCSNGSPRPSGGCNDGKEIRFVAEMPLLQRSGSWNTSIADNFLNEANTVSENEEILEDLQEMFFTGGRFNFEAIMSHIPANSSTPAGTVRNDAQAKQTDSQNFIQPIYRTWDEVANGSGIPWSSDTKDNLRSYFGQWIQFDPTSVKAMLISQYIEIDKTSRNVTKSLKPSVQDNYVLKLGQNQKFKGKYEDIQGYDFVGILPDENLQVGSNTSGKVNISDKNYQFNLGPPNPFKRRVSFIYTKKDCDPSDPSCGGNTGGGGDGKITFDPNDTTAMQPRGWSVKDFPVKATVTAEPLTFEQSIPWSYTPPNNCKPGDKNCTPPKPVTGTANYKCKRDIDPSVYITGSASGRGTVTIKTEGDDLTLHGVAKWKPVQETWSAPPAQANVTKPTCPHANAPDIEGDSGIYKLDKTDTTLSVSPTSQYWTNRPINITMNFGDNLSGFWDTGFKLDDISYYHQSQSNGTAPISATQYTANVTINRNGVYILTTQRGDYAGNPMNPPQSPTIQKFTDYRYDDINPYEAQFDLGSGAVAKNGTFDYIANESNTVKVRVGDDLSGVVNTEYSWSKNPSQSQYNVNDWGGSWNNLPLTTPDYASGANQYSSWIDVNVNSKTNYYQNQATSYDDLKEGTWFLHINITDRAGNVTHSVSPPIFVNKIKNLRINNISDFSWKSVFKTPLGDDSAIKINGIETTLFPLYYNKQNRNISLGYGVDYKFDTVGFDNNDDRVELKMSYHAIDEKGNWNNFLDVYTEDKKNNYHILKDDKYKDIADFLLFGRTSNSDAYIAYESGIKANIKSNYHYQNDIQKANYQTVSKRTYLPPTTLFVKKGKPLDLIHKNDIQTYKILVTYDIKGYRNGHSLPLLYSEKEDKWAYTKNWGTQTPNEYGYNRPSFEDKLGYGVNKGEVFWYDLQKTLQDDMKFNRDW